MKFLEDLIVGGGYFSGQEGEAFSEAGERSKYLKIVSPNGGEVFCSNDFPIVEWESEGVDVVSLRVIEESFGGGVTITTWV